MPGQDIVVPPSPYEYSEQTPEHISIYTNSNHSVLSLTHAQRLANRSNLLFYSGACVWSPVALFFAPAFGHVGSCLLFYLLYDCMWGSSATQILWGAYLART